MPELPEVETVARGLRPVLTGRTFAEVEVLWANTVARPDAKRFGEILTGATVRAVGRRGKYIVITLAGGWTLLVHLRMSGKFMVNAPEVGSMEAGHIRVRLKLDDGSALFYIDPRKFGRFFLVTDPIEVVGDLGPEPLSPEFTATWLVENLAGRQGEIKRLLLDQHFLAGLGNIYVSEVLWRAQIHPLRIPGTLSKDEIERLHAAIVDVLSNAVAQGGSSLDDRQYVAPDGQLGRYQNVLCVYDRAGEQCPRCKYTLERMVQGQRSTYFCPVCQSLTVTP